MGRNWPNNRESCLLRMENTPIHTQGSGGNILINLSISVLTILNNKGIKLSRIDFWRVPQTAELKSEQGYFHKLYPVHIPETTTLHIYSISNFICVPLLVTGRLIPMSPHILSYQKGCRSEDFWREKSLLRSGAPNFSLWSESGAHCNSSSSAPSPPCISPYLFFLSPCPHLWFTSSDEHYEVKWHMGHTATSCGNAPK